MSVDAAWPARALTSFDRQTRCTARVQALSSQHELEALPMTRARIARGGGVSYVAASFDRDAVSQSLAHLDHLVAFDAEHGILRVEAGISIAEVQRFALARGWYLRIAPGHARASVGGCIAVDAHGKNPARDGCFRAQLGALKWFHPDSGWQEAPRGSAAWQTAVGSYGLAGTIVEAELQLARAPIGVAIEPVPVASLAKAAEVLRHHGDASLLYGWHDAQPRHFGRGVIRVGHAIEDRGRAQAVARWRLPASVQPLPWRLWNAASLGVANAILRQRWLHVRQQSLVQALLPLNGATPYFAAYGPAGLVEAQWLWPHARFGEFAERLTALVRRRKPLLPLVSSKLFNGAADGIAFDGVGIALAIHVAMNGQGRAFLHAFDELALEFGGRPNPIKQSSLPADVMAAAIPELAAWRRRLAAVDPERRFQSEWARRLLA